jgi:hypothetical protein
MTFAEEFARAGGQPIQAAGHSVQMVYRRKVRDGLTLRVRWERRIEIPVQGISVSVKGGQVRVAGVRAKDIVLWADTAPEEVTLQCEGRDVSELSLWNCWRDEREVTQAWVGNSGMVVEQLGGGVLRFRCNSRPEITFGDLVFDLDFGGA